MNAKDRHPENNAQNRILQLDFRDLEEVQSLGSRRFCTADPKSLILRQRQDNERDIYKISNKVNDIEYVQKVDNLMEPRRGHPFQRLLHRVIHRFCG